MSDGGMREPVLYLGANLLWLAAGWRATRAFRRALREPRRAQEQILSSLLQRNADAEYGRRHGFRRLRTVREFQEAVPIVTYEVLEEEIEAIKRGRSGVLTWEPVLMLEKTSGSTAASKYIPYTASLKREFGAAVAPWMADLYGRRPAMLGGGAYWSVSPLASEPEKTEGGLPVGFEEDTEYFGALERMLLSRLILTPRELPRILDISASRYVTLRFLLQTPRLSFISVWNPSFLTLLMETLREHGGRLVDDIRWGTLRPPVPLPADLQRQIGSRLRPRPRRAADLERLFRGRRQEWLKRAWPHLAVISCWADGSASHFLPEVQELFPGVEIQPKGLLATEGVVSIPLTGYRGAAAAVTSHFLEFMEEDGAMPRVVDELEVGRSYSVLVTTGGGLYRYALGDRVRVVGYVERTPLLEFLGRESQVSDLCGEKLHEDGVRTALEAAFRELEISPTFVMVAPEWGEPPGYLLFLESADPPDVLAVLERRVEALLAEGYHYDYCRRLGQLRPILVVRLGPGASSAYLERCAALGQRRGSVKPAVLHRAPGWLEWFSQSGSVTYSR